MDGGRLDGRVAVITGSTRGIGRAIAEAYVAEGATVVVNSRDPAEAERVAAELGGGSLGIGTDVTDHEAVAALFARTLSELGRIDILVNNVGSSVASPAQDLPIADWERIIALNLTAPFACSQHAARAMLAAEPSTGHAIINIASIAAYSVPTGRVPYAAAKAGLVTMTHVLAAEWAPRIRVNAIAPGYTETSLLAELIARGDVDGGGLEGRAPAGRLGQPAEVAAAAVFLASDEASYVYGAVLPVDGGWLVGGHGV